MANKPLRSAHLELRHNTYFAVLYVPKDVQEVLNRTKFSKSLKTGDRRLAERRASAFVVAWKAEIARARNQPEDHLIQEAQSLLNAYNSSSMLVRDEAKQIIENRTDELDEGNSIEAEDFQRISLGKNQALSILFPGWIEAETAKGLQPKTLDQMERDVGRLLDVFKTAPSLTAEYTSCWLRDIGNEEGLSPSTITRIAGFCRNFFRYLQSIGEVSKDLKVPFDVPPEFRRSKKGRGANKIQNWTPFSSAEVVSLYEQAKANSDESLADLILIDAYSGARIEELCSLKCSDISLENESISIIESKSAAGVRLVPIHSAIKSRITELISQSKDGYLLSGLTHNKYGDRSNAIGKRFGRMKTRMGFPDSCVFHSIRKTLVTLLENSGVSENVAADIVGHEKPRITYGLYSGGTTLEVKKEAIEKVRYPFEQRMDS